MAGNWWDAAPVVGEEEEQPSWLQGEVVDVGPEPITDVSAVQQERARPQGPALPDPNRSIREQQMEALKSLPGHAWDAAVAGADVGASMASRAAGTALGGAAGLVNGFLTWDADNARSTLDTIQEAVGWDPKTERGKKLAQGLGEGTEAIAQEFAGKSVAESTQDGDDFFYFLGGGNPVSSAFWKTALLGAADVATPGQFKKGGLTTVKESVIRHNAIQTQKAKLKVQKAVDKAQVAEFGIDLSHENLHDSLIRAADVLAEGPSPRAYGAESTVAGIRAAEVAAKKAERAAWKELEAKDAALATDNFTQLGSTLRDELVQRYDLDAPEYASVNRALKELEQMDTDIPNRPSLRSKGEELDINTYDGTKPLDRYADVQMKELLMIRERLNNRITGDGTKLKPYTKPDSALIQIKRGLDRKIQDAFDNAAIKGDATVHESWTKARGATAAYKRAFQRDKVIRKIVQEGMDPDDVLKWVVGASAMGAKKESASVVRRLKEMLGDKHPGIIALRQAAIRDVVGPMLGDNPNFKAAVRNVDKLMRDNPTLVKELDINTQQLEVLRNAARAAEHVGALPKFWNKGRFSQITASLLFGHQIAKRAAHIRLFRGALDKVIGTGYMSDKKLLDYFEAYRDYGPMVPREGAGSKEILAYGAIADSFESDEEDE